MEEPHHHHLHHHHPHHHHHRHPHHWQHHDHAPITLLNVTGSTKGEERTFSSENTEQSRKSSATSWPSPLTSFSSSSSRICQNITLITVHHSGGERCGTEVVIFKWKRQDGENRGKRTYSAESELQHHNLFIDFIIYTSYTMYINQSCFNQIEKTE